MLATGGNDDGKAPTVYGKATRSHFLLHISHQETIKKLENELKQLQNVQTSKKAAEECPTCREVQLHFADDFTCSVSPSPFGATLLDLLMKRTAIA